LYKKLEFFEQRKFTKHHTAHTQGLLLALYYLFIIIFNFVVAVDVRVCRSPATL